jgi:hypothetical protein
MFRKKHIDVTGNKKRNTNNALRNRARNNVGENPKIFLFTEMWRRIHIDCMVLLIFLVGTTGSNT